MDQHTKEGNTTQDKTVPLQNNAWNAKNRKILDYNPSAHPPCTMQNVQYHRNNGTYTYQVQRTPNANNIDSGRRKLAKRAPGLAQDNHRTHSRVQMYEQTHRKQTRKCSQKQAKTMGTKRSCQTGHDPDIQSSPSNMGPIM
jgi:hypothetical protein